MATNSNGKNFEDLQKYIAKAEHVWASSSNPKDFIRSGNFKGSGSSAADYHLGYFQLSGRHIRTICNYISAITTSQGEKEVEYWYDNVMLSAFNDLKNKTSCLDCLEFPTLFGEHEQAFFHAIFVAQALYPIRSKALVNGHHYTVPDVVLYNLTGHFGVQDSEPWTGFTLFNDIHAGGVTAWSYIFNSGCLGNVGEEVNRRIQYTTTGPEISSDDLSKVFEVKAVYRDESPSMREDCKIVALKHWNQSSLLNRLLPAQSQVEGLFTAGNLKLFAGYVDPNYTAPLAGPPGAGPSASFPPLSSTSDLPFMTDMISYYDRLKESPAIYRQGRGAEEKGLLFIGDLLFSLPPVAIRFSESNQAMSIPAMRVEGDPVLSSNNSIPRVELTLYFNGERAINEQLRPLVAMYQSMPFTTIQNTTIWDSWVGRREDLTRELVGNPIHRFYPVPCYLENISLSTIPGFPNTVQAHISLSQMDRIPYGASASMWRNPEDAFEQAKKNAIRYALDNVIIDSSDPNKLKILDSAHQLFEYNIPDDAKDGNAVMDPMKTTPYPQESIPFKYMYRERLVEYPAMEFDEEAKQTMIKDPITHWPVYQSDHNKKLYLSYKAPKRFSTIASVFKKRFQDAVAAYNRVQAMLAVLGELTPDQFNQFYKDIEEVSPRKLVDSWLGSIASVKELRNFGKGLNSMSRKILNTVLADDSVYLPHLVNKDSQTIVFRPMFDTNDDGVINEQDFITLRIDEVDNDIFRYVDDQMEIVDSWDEFLKWLGGFTGNNGFCEEGADALTYIDKISCEAAGNSWRVPDPEEEITMGGQTKSWKEWGLQRINTMLGPFIERFKDASEELHLDSIESKLNYETVGVELSWLTDTDVLLDNELDIARLVEENRHREKTAADAYNNPFYQFQSVIQSITYNYANNVVPLFTASNNKPTYQHMGIPNSTATVVFRTRDERLHKIIRDMQESTQEVGFQLLGGNYRLAGLGTVDITGKLLAHSSDRASDQDGQLIHGQGRGPMSGQLLNSLGFNQSVIQNLSSRTIEGHPGWWEVTLDLMQDTQNIRILEYLSPTLHSTLPNLMSMIEYLFPFYLVDWTALDTKLVEDSNVQSIANEWFTKQFAFDDALQQYKDDNNEQMLQVIKELTQPDAGFLKGKTNAFLAAVPGVCKAEDGTELPFQNQKECEKEEGATWKIRTSTKITIINAILSGNLVAAGMILGLNADTRTALSKTREAQGVANIARTSNKLKEEVEKALSKYISLDKGLNETIHVIVVPKEPADELVIKLNTNNTEKEDTINKIFEPIKRSIKVLLQNMATWEAKQRLDSTFDAKFPKEFGLTATMSAYYRDFLELLVRTMTNLAAQNPTLFLEWDKRAMIFPTSLEHEYAALNLSNTEIFVETMIMLSNTKQVFYSLAKRADFRQWLSQISVRTNEAYILREEQLASLIDELTTLKAATTSATIPDNIKKGFITNIDKRSNLLTKFAENLRTTSIFRDTTPVNTGQLIEDFLNQLNLHIKSNHPDLRLPDAALPRTGHRIISPGFPFVDDDLDLELVEMSKIIDNLKLVTYAQFAAVATGDFGEYWDELLKAFESSPKTLEIAQKFLDSHAKDGAFSDVLIPDYMSDERCEGAEAITKNECLNAGGSWKQRLSATQIWASYIGSKDRLDQKKLKKKMTQGAKAFSDIAFAAPSKQSLMKLMTTTVMLDYLSSLLFASSWFTEAEKGRPVTGEEAVENLTKAAGNILNELQTLDTNPEKYAQVLANAIMFQWEPYDDSNTKLVMDNKTREVGRRVSDYLADKLKHAAAVATISSTGDYQAFMNYFGIGDISGVKKSYQLKSKFNNYLQNKRKGSMDKAFPTFKIFFIEEDNYAWHAFDDVYTYDAASEITIVESKHAASKTAVLKLSNVTQALTNDHSVGEMLNETAAITPGEALRVKPGTEIMILIGYGADYRNLRMKFKGAITEVNPGPILEITAQSWGAGLLNNVGSTGGIEYSALSGAATMGAAIIDILANTPGLSKLGRWEIRKQSLTDVQKTSETALRTAYYARALNSVMGWTTDFLPLSTNIQDIVGKFTGEGLPTTGVELLRQYRDNNVLIKNFGNSLYDNIIINNTNPKGYGFWNLATRFVEAVGSPKEGGFNWTVVRQTGWDALHEIALFMGDYIVTTLPYNEGNDLFSTPPRETLYFGPREGHYKAQTNVPTPSVDNQLDELKTVIAQIIDINTTVKKSNVAGLSPTEQETVDSLIEQQHEKMDEILTFGKALLAPLISFTADSYPTVNAGNRRAGLSNITATEASVFDRWKSMEQGTEAQTLQQAMSGHWSRNYGKEIGLGGASTAASGNKEDFLSAFDQLLDLNGFTNMKKWLRDHTYLIFEDHIDDINAATMWDTNREQILEKIATFGLGYNNPDLISRLNMRYGLYFDKPVDQYTAEEITLYNAEARQFSVEKGLEDTNAPLIYTERLINRANLSSTALHELLLDDFGHKNMPSSLGSSYFYHAGDWELIEMLKGHDKGPMEEDLNDKNYLVNDSDPKFMYNGMGMGNTDSDSKDYIWNLGMGQTDFEAEHWGRADYSNIQSGLLAALMPGITMGMGTVAKHADNRRAFFNIISKWFAPSTKLSSDQKTYSKCEELIYEDTVKIINDYDSLKQRQADRDPNQRYEPYLIDFEQAIIELGGLTDIFSYKPVVQQHAVNSYEDIIDNSIIASHDQMYNHVELLYPSKPDSADDPNNAVYRHQAYVSYDQDLDYLRSYQVYMKNLDPNIYFDLNDAKAYMKSFDKDSKYWGEEGTSAVKRAFMLKQHQVAQSILLNVIKPMYQGTLTVMGNPHIRPWDILHIHDDSIRMYGPVEVEQVVTSISATNGYTTTIIPNLLVYFKDSSTMLDGLLMDLFRTINSMSVLGNSLKHSAMLWIGARTLGIKAKPWKNEGSWLFSSSLGAKWAKKYGSPAKKANEISSITTENWKTKKKFAKKNLLVEEFEDLDNIMSAKNTGRAVEKQAETAMKNITFGIGKDAEIKAYTALTDNVSLLRAQRVKLGVQLLEAGTGEMDTNPEWIALTNKITVAQEEAAAFAERMSVKGSKMNTLYSSGAGVNRGTMAANEFTKLLDAIDDAVSPYDKKFLAKGAWQARVNNLERLGVELDRLQTQLINIHSTVKEGGTFTSKQTSKIASLERSIMEVTTKIEKRISMIKDQLIQKKILGQKGGQTVSSIIDSALKNKRKDALEDVSKSLVSRKAWASGVAKFLNWAGWIYTAYEIADFAWEAFESTSRSHVFQAGLLAGENCLTPVFLEYQGKPYVAGFEGIIGSPRGISTILHGQLAGDSSNSNRSLLIMDLVMSSTGDLEEQ